MGRPVLLAIDVEPDERMTSAGDAWMGTRGAVTRFGALRSELERRTGKAVRFNWFFRIDPQIERCWGRADWALHSLPDLMEAISQYGDATGIHPHLWKWNEEHQTWYNEFADPAWGEHCLRMAVQGYCGVFGRAPESCRFGDRWLTNELVQLERQLGIRYDLTIEPGAHSIPSYKDPLATAWLPDYRSAPRVPYRPSAANCLRDAGEGSLWILPTSVSAPRWQVSRRRPFVRRFSYPANLVLFPAFLGRYLAREIEREALEPIVMALRAGDLAQPELCSNFEHTIKQICASPGLRGCEFTDSETAIRVWTGS